MLSPLQHTTVRVAALEGLDTLLQAAGSGLQAVLRRLGIDPVVLAEPEHRLAFKQFVQVLDAAAAITGDDCLGLHLGAAQSPRIAGVLGYALQSSPDVRAQLALAVRYFALHQDGAEVELSVDGGVATLRYAVLDPHVLMHRHDAEATLALCVGQWRVHTGHAQWAPASVHFEHPEPAPGAVRALEGFFRCPVRFGEPLNGARFPAAFLDTPLRTADSALHAILSRYAEESLARHAGTTTLAGRARRLIAAGLAHGAASIDEVARRLALSPRTLQRQLGDAGLQFTELVDETRRELAARYLRDERISLTDAAFLVGYSDLTAFHRAFRRWFQQTPLEYQRQQRAATVSSSRR